FFKRYALAIGVTTFVLLRVLMQMRINMGVYEVFFDTSTALCFSSLVSAASIGFRGRAGTLLEWKPLVYCGKIAYGIYVYHLFMPGLLASIFVRFNAIYPEKGWLNFFFATAATLFVASLSWYLFEQPLN